MKLYGVIDPKGFLKDVCFSSLDAKSYIFNRQERIFKIKYLYKVESGWKAAKKLGWKIEIGEYSGLCKYLK